MATENRLAMHQLWKTDEIRLPDRASAGVVEAAEIWEKSEVGSMTEMEQSFWKARDDYADALMLYNMLSSTDYGGLAVS